MALCLASVFGIIFTQIQVLYAGRSLICLKSQLNLAPTGGQAFDQDIGSEIEQAVFIFGAAI
jgi:hypothetical protein